jgi:hypothetical protein
MDHEEIMVVLEAAGRTLSNSMSKGSEFRTIRYIYQLNTIILVRGRLKELTTAQNVLIEVVLLITLSDSC